MNYARIYDQLIERARIRSQPEGYVEHHHVVPRCMGGSDERSNLVPLTAREHFVAHLLLVKIYPSIPGVYYSAYRMSKRHLYKTSRKYSSLRDKVVQNSKNIGNRHKEKGTGIFTEGAQRKGGIASARIQKEKGSKFHSFETRSKAGAIGGKLPWFHNPETGKTMRAKEAPEGWVSGRGRTLDKAHETQRTNGIGIFNKDIQLKASTLGVVKMMETHYAAGTGIFKKITCSCGRSMNIGNFNRHQKATGHRGVK